VGAWPCFALLSLLFPLLPAPVRAASYDTIVMVVASGPDTAQVAVSYSRVVNHAQLTTALHALGRSTGATLGAPSVRDDRVATGSATSAEVDARGLLPAGRALPVAAIAAALPGWQHLRVLFVLPPDFHFVGPTDASTSAYGLRLVGQSGGYSYDVERVGGAPTSSAEPVPTGSAAPPQRAAGGGGGIRTAVTGGCALAAGVALVVLVRALRKPR